MNRNDYDKKVLAVFDTVGSFLTDIVYNDLYEKAVGVINQNHEGGPKSITDAYRANIINYMKGVKRVDLYRIVIKKLHEYYQRYSGFGGIVFGEFVDKIVSQFIPSEYFKDFTGQNKDKTLHDIIVWTVADIAEFILEPDMLRRIIDNHLDVANVTLIQDRIMEILIIMRENYYAKFASELANANKGSVDHKVVNKLKDAIAKEAKLRVEAEADRDRATNMLSGCLSKMREHERTISQLQLEIERLRHEKTQILASSKEASSRSGAPTNTTSSNKSVSLLDQALDDDDPPAKPAPRGRGRPKKSETVESPPAKPVHRAGGRATSVAKKAMRTPAPPKPSAKKAPPPPPSPPQEESEDESEGGTGESEGESEDSSVEAISEEELHRRQKAALKLKRGTATPATPTTSTPVANILVDDPGFG
jgi:hypothetical protein